MPSASVRVTPSQPRQRANRYGTNISSASTPTPLVITPRPAAKQPSQYARQFGPRRKCSSRPQLASVIQPMISGSICARLTWYMNWNANSSAIAA